MGEHRRKRDAEARRKPKAMAVIAPLAVLATASVVAVGVVAADPTATDLAPLGAAASAPAAPAAAAASSSPTAEATRSEAPVTRTEDRMSMRTPTTYAPRFMSKEATKAAVKNASIKRWTTTELNVWSQPGAKAKQLGEIEAGERVVVTGREIWGRTEIVVKGQARWVSDGYLSHDEPPKLGGDCTNGTSVAGGVSPSIVAVHEAVCSNFPDISVYGTLRGGGGDHPLGKAVDIMVSGSEGRAVAEFVRENYAALGVSYIIYEQQIWSVERAGEGWRGMENRGSATANHFDHVHVSVY